MEYFTILMKTNNKLENKDTNDLILGKYDTKNNTYKIFKLKVNSGVSINFYHKLLLEDDFCNSDFKEIEIDTLKSQILSSISRVKKWLFNGVCGDLENYINENFGA